MSDTLMISVSGIRGQVGTDLTPELVTRYAAALGAWSRLSHSAGTPGRRPAVVLGRVRTRLSTNGLLGAAGIIYAAALAVIVLVPNFPTALVTLVFAGLSWTAVISTLIAELQLFLKYACQVGAIWLLREGVAPGGKKLGLMGDVARSDFKYLRDEEIAALLAPLRPRS